MTIATYVIQSKDIDANLFAITEEVKDTIFATSISLHVVCYWYRKTSKYALAAYELYNAQQRSDHSSSIQNHFGPCCKIQKGTEAYKIHQIDGSWAAWSGLRK